ncbi:PLD nuclease N-terminal domain-containing protein [Actinosynnema sp. NPDC091369]
MKRHKTRLEMTPAQRRGILAMTVVIAVNFVGPLAYFRWGRKGSSHRPHRDRARCSRREREANSTTA